MPGIGARPTSGGPTWSAVESESAVGWSTAAPGARAWNVSVATGTSPVGAMGLVCAAASVTAPLVLATPGSVYAGADV